MNCVTSLQDEYCSANAISSNFLHALQAFLGRNQIDYLKHFRIRLESTNEGNSTLSITGTIDTHSRHSPDHVDAAWAWSSTRTPPNEVLPPYETAEVMSTMTGRDQSACVSLPDVRHTDVESTCSGIEQTRVLPFQPGEIFDVLSQTCQFPSEVEDLLALPTPSISSSPNSVWNIPGLSPPFDCFESMGMDVQGSQISSDRSAASHLNDSPFANWTTRTPLIPNSEITNSHPSVTAPSAANTLVQFKEKSDTLRESSELTVSRLSQNVLRDDLYCLLQSELPRWTREGLSGRTQSATFGLDMLQSAASDLPSSYSKLERAYTTVCQLNSRLDDDLLRNRIALIQLHLEYVSIHKGQRHKSARTCNESLVGRGNASHVIDSILANTHKGWRALDRKCRAELRAKFHERKKYGKRWCQLANGLGPGILLVCSSKLANAVRSTTATANILDAVVKRVKLSDDETVKIIDIVSPLAESLMKNEGFDKLDHCKILSQLRSCSTV